MSIFFPLGKSIGFDITSHVIGSMKSSGTEGLSLIWEEEDDAAEEDDDNLNEET